MMDAESTAPDGADAFVRAVAANVRALRQEAGLTLDALAATAGLGRSTLAQIESGRANPSVETLWAIAAALSVPFARLIDEPRPLLRVVRARDALAMHAEEAPSWVGRLLTASSRRGSFELYSLDVAAGEARHADAHTPLGVVEHLLVVSGRLRAGPADRPAELAAGDLISFAADVPHLYEAVERTHAILVMDYP